MFEHIRSHLKQPEPWIRAIKNAFLQHVEIHCRDLQNAHDWNGHRVARHLREVEICEAPLLQLPRHNIIDAWIIVGLVGRIFWIKAKLYVLGVALCHHFLQPYPWPHVPHVPDCMGLCNARKLVLVVLVAAKVDVGREIPVEWWKHAVLLLVVHLGKIGWKVTGVAVEVEARVPKQPSAFKWIYIDI